MKKYSLLVTTLLMCLLTNAQYSLTWQNSEPSGKTINTSTADAADNLVIAGFFSNTISFGTHTLTQSGVSVSSNYIAKMNAGGSWLWAKKINIIAANLTGIAQANIYDVITDNTGNIYITGRFMGTVSFDNITLVESVTNKSKVHQYIYSSDIFVAKLNSAGTFLWAKREGGVYADESRGVRLDAAGNVYIAGVTQKTQGSAYVPETYVAKYNTSGTKQWEKKFTVSNNTSLAFGAADIAIDGLNNLYITGVYRGTATFANNMTLTSATLCTYLAKLSSTNGSATWARSATGNDNRGKSLLIDNANNVYVSGIYRFDPISFGAFTLPAPTWIYYIDSDNTFLVKYSPAGNPLWATQAINTDQSSFFVGCNKLFHYPGGKIGLYTDAQNGLHIKNFDPASGIETGAVLSAGFTWDDYNNNNRSAAANTVTPVSTGFVFGLRTNTNISFEDLTLVTVPPSTNLFLVKYTDAPPPIAARQAGTAEEKVSTSLVLFPNPVQNQLTIQNRKNELLGNISIIDASGKIVYQQMTGNSKTTIDVRGFSAGAYYLRTDKSTSALKFIKQ